MAEPSVETKLCGMKLKSPFILASGVWGCSAGTMIRAAKEGAGAVTSKSCSLEPREGHRNPTVVRVSECITMNAVGLSNPGVGEEIEELKIAIKESASPVIASIVGKKVEDYAEVARRISAAKPAMIEANISCPNVLREGKMFAASEQDAAEVTRAVKAATRIPVSMKISPNVTDIASIAKACEAAGADSITAINTVSGMIIDPVARKPVLTNKIGGMSGPAIKPVALRCVYQISKAVGIPIIGTGGISTGKDAAEMLMAGATAVGVGTACYEGGTFTRLNSELKDFMKRYKYSKLGELKLEE